MVVTMFLSMGERCLLGHGWAVRHDASNANGD